jgi:hypothetical protein
MNEQAFLIGGEWTKWYTDDDDLSFLNNNVSVEAMEESAEMSRKEVDELKARCART